MSGKPFAERPLTIRMYHALACVRAQPNLPADEYPGGLRTIDALRRRRLVRVSLGAAVTPTEAGAQIHLHKFQTTLHMDGCHYYSTVATCECGAVYSFYGERDLKDDPYSAIWMEPDGKSSCQRCEELMDGAKPKYREEITEPKAKATA